MGRGPSIFFTFSFFLCTFLLFFLGTSSFSASNSFFFFSGLASFCLSTSSRFSPVPALACVGGLCPQINVSRLLAGRGVYHVRIWLATGVDGPRGPSSSLFCNVSCAYRLGYWRSFGRVLNGNVSRVGTPC